MYSNWRAFGRKTCDEIEIDVVDPAIAGASLLRLRPLRLYGGGRAAQFFVDEGLDSEAHAVDAALCAKRRPFRSDRAGATSMVASFHGRHGNCA